MGKILLVITTYNQSEYTKLCFESLKKLDDDFDVLVVDDCSTDDTIELCNEYGYEVVTKDEGRGLTHSWNLGYERFKGDILPGWASYYDYLILANNDILIPDGALAELISVYDKWPYSLIVPTTTINGAGHNAQFQSVELYYDGIGSFCNDSKKYQYTQDNILKVKNDIEKSNNIYQLDPVRVKMFNGFFFMMNRNIINYEYEDNVLFNPSLVMTKNEDEFNWSKLIPNDDFPAVCKTSFVYHFKGVSAAGDLRNNEKWKDTRFKNE